MDKGREELGYVKRKGINVLVEGAESDTSPERENFLRRHIWTLATAAGIVPTTLFLGNVIDGTEGGYFGGVLEEPQKQEQKLGEIQDYPKSSELIVEEKKGDFDLIYPGLIEDERNEALKVVEDAQTTMQKNLGPLEIQRVSNNEAIIRKSAKDAGVPENLLLGLVIAESKGDPYAVSSAGAKGLTQIMDETAKELEIKIYEGEGDERDDERYIPEIVLPKSAKALREEYDRFGNWGLALWSWHAGDPVIYRAIRTYCQKVLSIDLPDIIVEEADQSEESKTAAIEEVARRRELYKDTIAENDVNLYKLFRDENIIQMFSGSQWDKTEEYVPRILASIEIYTENSDSNQAADNTVNR